MPASKRDRPQPCDVLVDPAGVPFVSTNAGGRLPHLYKPSCTFFVTFCLQDSAPAKTVRRRALDETNDPEQLAILSEPHPDRGSLALQSPEIANLVEESLLHFNGVRYALHAWVVMPNHVHVVLTPSAGFNLAEILHSWKSFTASKINRKLGRNGQLWQRESFDHLVRNQESLLRFIAYTHDNPVAAGLARRPEDWPFSSARFGPTEH